MIVAFYLESDGPAIADVDHAGIFFAGLDQNIRSRGGKFFEFFARILVGAVLAPHDRENSKLGKVRVAPEDGFDAFEFVRREPVPGHEVGSYGGLGD